MKITTASGQSIPATVSDIVEALCTVAGSISHRIAISAIDDNLGTAVGANTDGDSQKLLDVIADDSFRAALSGSDIRWYASEEKEEVDLVNPDGGLAIAIDPLDGSSNIGVNVSIGTIFGIQPALEEASATFLRAGHNLIASGYFIYGPQTALIITFGAGVRQFVYDPRTQIWTEVKMRMFTPGDSSEFAINASNYRHWARPIRAYIDDCLAGNDGPRGKDFNMRWVASLVAETHRILTRGGIFLYPRDEREGYENGRLRMVYECAPMAMLVEQAGGKATDGTTRILDLKVDHLHARTPFVFGSPDKVDRVAAYFDLPTYEVSALFGHRGLFRE
ncbi:MAG: class 1 fructose-bisphosphatase [Pseudoruegeria sp.]